MRNVESIRRNKPYQKKNSAAKTVSQLAALSGTPYSAMVEIADRCNEACVHCYQVQGQKGELDTEQWKRIFRELAEMGVLFLTISGGEPTLRKDFIELVAFARQLRFAVKIYSNALNITPALAAELGRLAVHEVQISLYSHLARVHDSVTRVPGSFDRVVAATTHLRRVGVKVLLKTPLLSFNSSDFREYVDFVQSLDAEYALDPTLNPREDGSLEPTKFGIRKRDYFAVRRDGRMARLAGTAPKPIRSDAERMPCGACRGSVHVEPNGELRPCTLWNVPTGSALNGVKEAWHNDATATAIRSLTWKDLPDCSVCDLKRYCQRCFADAEQYAGNALAPYAQACRVARWQYELVHGVEPEIDRDADSCAVMPVGPFRATGSHRFSVAGDDPPSARRGIQGHEVLSAGTSRAAPQCAISPQLLQIRRHRSRSP
ncbi:MAG TPA: radical SAM protein [Polyangiaceae bacterium]|nr:radical SAM protein [Polyangiaceae bacterium]